MFQSVRPTHVYMSRAPRTRQPIDARVTLVLPVEIVIEVMFAFKDLYLLVKLGLMMMTTKMTTMAIMMLVHLGLDDKHDSRCVRICTVFYVIH